ncbi:MAG: hypothetical protein KJ726_11050 [Verrucomicrobia bacterium]|nr:hypothetical protein [Verrucomicrobiota bacterium]
MAAHSPARVITWSNFSHIDSDGRCFAVRPSVTRVARVLHRKPHSRANMGLLWSSRWTDSGDSGQPSAMTPRNARSMTKKSIGGRPGPASIVDTAGSDWSGSKTGTSTNISGARLFSTMSTSVRTWASRRRSGPTSGTRDRTLPRA